MDFQIRPLNKHEFIAAAPTLVDIYLTAMRYDTSLRDTRITAWRQHTQLPGFAAVAALRDGVVAGVAYGHAGVPMHWWHTQIQRGLHTRHQYTDCNRRILCNYFELSEIHVLPEFQGNKLGENMLRTLVKNVRQPVILLSTPEVDNEANGAFGLYRKLGFQDLLRHHFFAGDSRPFAILKAQLPLPQ
ncbi:GNAT family N-acetyltransferase [Staphylococcus chromogenes]|nr:GNAT family N-acetyltransferase [Staphylococcus chromogenes]